MESYELEYDSVIDEGDSSDFQYGELMGAEPIEIPEKVDLSDKFVANQGAQKETWYACVFYATANGINIANEIEGSGVKVDHIKFSQKAVEKKLLNPTRGARIISGPKHGREEGYLDGFLSILSLDQVKHSLAKNRAVVTGTNKADWRGTANMPYFLVNKEWSYGHAFLIVGYDDNKGLLKCKNSYGDKKYDKGYFYVKYDDFSRLFNTKYSLVDKSDIDLYRKRIMEQIKIPNALKAFEENMWSGVRPQEPISREEAVAVIYEQFTKLKLELKKNK